jgi:hypothetical protein
MSCRGVTPSASSRITRLPASTATSCLSGSTAGTDAEPIAESPKNSIATAIVLAVY